MMQGLDDTFDAVFFVGYHGSISGRPSTLSHTYNPEVFAAARVNGELGGRERHQRAGRRALRRPDRVRLRRRGHLGGDRAVRAGRGARGHQGVDHPVQRRATCTRPSPAG